MASHTPSLLESADSGYLDWEAADSPVSIHLNLGVMDALSGEVIEGFKALPRRGIEVGGLLLGRVEQGDRPAVWIERYRRVDCHHRFGPQFVLDQEEREAFEATAREIVAAGELTVVGLYRSHTRPGFQLEESDLELIDAYFSDPTDLVLLIRPENLLDITAQFFLRGQETAMHAAGEAFPFRARVLGTLSEPLAKRPITPVPDPVPAITLADSPPAAPIERHRRLVPDFMPAAVEPPQQFNPDDEFDADPEITTRSPVQRRFWPVLATIALVGGIILILIGTGTVGRNPSPQQPAAIEATRPLGLYVNPEGATWRVSWNPSATALRSARAVELFVREGDDQNRIDLSPADLKSGSYQYHPNGNDVAFRLEVTETNGRISSESFRMMKAAAAPPAPVAKTAPASPGRNVSEQPRAIHRVPPVIPAGIRPRIDGKIPIDIRVRIDPRGRVISAVPATRTHAGLETFLAQRAVYAAKQWRFEPARENGRPVAGSQTIHFEFEK